MNDPRPPLSPALLAQAEDIAPGMCFGYDETQHVIGAAMPSEHGQAIVTWLGRDAAEKAEKAEK